MKSRMIIVSSVVGLALLVLIYFIGTSKSGNKYQWFESFRNDSNQPYGTLFIQKMLESSYEGDVTINQKETVHKLLDDNKFNDGVTDYVLIGQSIHLDDQDVQVLKDFIARGNNVFIATMDVPAKMVDAVYSNVCDEEFLYDYNYDTAIYANFYDSAFKKQADYEYAYRIGSNDIPYAWRALSYDVICDTTGLLQPIGYQQADLVNYLSIQYGSGKLYLHTAPLMFTNYFLTKKDKMEYASSVFAQLQGDNLIWDEVSKVPFSDLQNPYDSPLYYIMQQPALKYAWWMLLAGGLLYIIFASKRTQRVIPVLERKTNTSLEFLNVISSLHYQNPNHLDMARKKMKYFLYFIRAKYGINTQMLSEDQAKRLAEKSKVDPADIQAIIQQYRLIENYSISNDEPERLVGLYQAIEKFYKNCK